MGTGEQAGSWGWEDRNVEVMNEDKKDSLREKAGRPSIIGKSINDGAGLRGDNFAANMLQRCLTLPRRGSHRSGRVRGKGHSWASPRPLYHPDFYK